MAVAFVCISLLLALGAADAFDFAFGFGGDPFGIGYRPRPDTCEPRDIIVTEAYIGWPMRLSCAKLAYDYSDIAYDQFLFSTPPAEHHETHCLIVDKQKNITVLDKSYRVWSWEWLGYRYPYKLMNDLTADSSTQYMMQLKTLSTCTYEDLTLNLMPSPNMTCQEVSEKEEHAIYRVDHMSSDHVIDCEVNYYHGRMVTSLDHLMHDYTVTWYKDCERLEPEKSNGTYTQKEDTLVFGTVDYSASGTYSCEISYKGLKRTGLVVDLCVRPPRTVLPPVIKCPKIVRAKLNSNVSVTCTVKLSYKPHKSTKPNVQWRQETGKSRHVCIEHGGAVVGKHDNRSHCSSEFRASQECFSHDPTIEEQQSSILLTFKIDNFKLPDAGKYSATFKIGASTVGHSWKMRVKREGKMPENPR